MRFILVSGTSFVSKLIQWQTRSHWSHAALLFSDDTVIEAREFIGVRRLHYLTWLQENGKTPCEVFTVSATDEQEALIRAYADAQVGKPYAYISIARFITRRDYEHQPDDAWFCSELTFEAIKRGQIELLDRTEGWEVPPHWLARSPLAL
jgi:uncharacterized protein YycO